MMRDKDDGQGHSVPEFSETEWVNLLGKSVNDSMQSSLEEAKRSLRCLLSQENLSSEFSA